jgi:hypothetical protein
MIAIDTIQPGMAVVGSDGIPIGVADAVEGRARLKLTGQDGTYHFLPLQDAARVEAGSIILNTPAATAVAAFDREIPAGEDTT